MKLINIDDMNNMKTVGPQEAANVKGGPMYLKLEGVKGDVRSSTAVTDQFSLNYEEIRL